MLGSYRFGSLRFKPKTLCLHLRGVDSDFKTHAVRRVVGSNLLGMIILVLASETLSPRP